MSLPFPFVTATVLSTFALAGPALIAVDARRHQPDMDWSAPTHVDTTSSLAAIWAERTNTDPAQAEASQETLPTIAIHDTPQIQLAPPIEQLEFETFTFEDRSLPPVARTSELDQTTRTSDVAYARYATVRREFRQVHRVDTGANGTPTTGASSYRPFSSRVRQSRDLHGRMQDQRSQFSNDDLKTRDLERYFDSRGGGRNRDGRRH